MNRKILIVYISTGLYNKMWSGFEATVMKFCPDTVKIIHRFSNEKFENHSDYTYIEHMPWPIQALMKFHRIREAMDRHREDEYSHVFYFNSNIAFRDYIPEELFLTNKIIAAHNCGWEYLGKDPLKFTYGVPIDKKSRAYICDGYYEYVQSSMFGGPVDLMKRLCDECIDMTEYDLAHNRIPAFHDESYYNKFINDNLNIVTILDGNYNMCEVNKERYGYPNAKIVMRDSSLTQYQYKDKFHIK